MAPGRWLVVLLVWAPAWLGCEGGSPLPGNVASAGRSEPVVEVTTTPARRGNIAQRISTTGSLVARRESRIGAEVRGRLERIFVSEGDRVAAGDRLFQIDRVPYEIALRRARAGVDLARAERHQLEADLARARKLRNEAVISQQQIDRLATSLDVARAREREAREAVALAEQNLERTLVRAPYAASVAERLADEGTTALETPQTIVLVLQETAELEAHASIPESHHSLIRIGDPALLHLEALPQPIQTRIASVSDTIDPANRTYAVRMLVPNADHRLKAGIFARVEILPREKTDVVLVPRAAIRSEDGQTSVLTIENGRATPRTVKLGLVTRDEVEILEGLVEAEEVIAGDAARTLAPGIRVRVVDGSAGKTS